jgi:hypothetical protein
MPSDA